MEKENGSLIRTALCMGACVIIVAALAMLGQVTEAEAKASVKSGWYLTDGTYWKNDHKASKVRITKKAFTVKAALYRIRGKNSGSDEGNRIRGRYHKFRLAKKVRFYDIEVKRVRIPEREARHMINTSGPTFSIIVFRVQKGKVDYFGFHG